MFEKFYRLPGEPKEGAGLGLAICREIVRAHDGQIGVTPGPEGRGSEFFFVLPAGGMNGGGNLSLSMNHAKIFLVDDERTIRLTFRLALETDGYEVQEAASADEALVGFETEKFDLTVLDLRIGRGQRPGGAGRNAPARHPDADSHDHRLREHPAGGARDAARRHRLSRKAD